MSNDYPYFEVLKLHYAGTIEPSTNRHDCTVNLNIKIGSTILYPVAEGNGPVNATDIALKYALRKYYPEIDNFPLLDHKTKALDTGELESFLDFCNGLGSLLANSAIKACVA